MTGTAGDGDAFDERADLLRLIDAGGGPLAQIATAQTLEQLRLLAVELLFLRTVPQYTAEDAAKKAGVSVEQITAMRRAVGLPPVAADDRRYNDDDVRVAATLVAATEFFGPAATMQLMRVVGAAMARIAEAAVSTFVTTAIAEATALFEVRARPSWAACSRRRGTLVRRSAPWPRKRGA